MHSIQTLARDLYSKDTHFILELIQNAEDNSYNHGEPSLEFRLYSTDPTRENGTTGALIIHNNEIGFSHDNVDAICQVGKTTKSKIQGYIGEKGIGFKSVFRVTSNPCIFSNGYRFCLPEHDPETRLGFIVPKWIEVLPERIDSKQTTIVLPLDKTEFGFDKIRRMLLDIQPETILFLTKLKKIQIITDIGDTIAVIKDDSKAPLDQILIGGQKEGQSISEVREFLVFSRVFQKPDNVYHEKREGVVDRAITVAVPIGDDGKSTGGVFAYLPVHSDLALPVIINADFILTSSREAIQGDVEWNRWLAKCVAEVTVEALEGLRGQNHLTVDFLNELAGGLRDLSPSELFYPIAEEIRNALLDNELLPADDGTYVSARNAKLARDADLRKLLNHGQLRSLFQSEDMIKWLSGEITRDRTPGLYAYLVDELDMEEIRPDGFARKMTESFLANQSDDWFIGFYKYLTDQEALWRAPRWRGDSPGILRSKPIILLDDGKLVSPFNSQEHPNAYLPPEYNVTFPVVKRTIVANEEARTFLEKKIQLTEPDEIAEVIENILPRYRATEGVMIDEETYQADLKAIARALKTDSQQKKESLITEALITPFVKSTNAKTSKEEFRRPEQCYLPNDDMKIYLGGNEDGWFACESVQKELSNYGSDLGLTDTVKIKCSEPQFSRHYVALPYKGGYRRGMEGYDPEIIVDGLYFALNNPTAPRTELIWNRIARPYSRCIKGKVITSSRQDFSPDAGTYREEPQISQFGQWLRDLYWLPNARGGFSRPVEISLDDLPESFTRDEILADKLGMRKNIVAKLAEEAGIKVEDIELLRKHPEEFKQWKAEIAARFEKPIFPTKSVENRERRQERVLEEIAESPEKEYEPRTRSVRITEATEYTRTWLKEQYTNENGEMLCQICRKVPFKKRNGEYYFEAVEALSRDYFPKEHEAQFLALCPLCAAMYKEFVKADNEAMKILYQALKDADETEDEPDVSLKLGELATSIRFVESHLFDLKIILGSEE